MNSPGLFPVQTERDVPDVSSDAEEHGGESLDVDSLLSGSRVPMRINRDDLFDRHPKMERGYAQGNSNVSSGCVESHSTMSNDSVISRLTSNRARKHQKCSTVMSDHAIKYQKCPTVTSDCAVKPEKRPSMSSEHAAGSGERHSYLLWASVGISPPYHPTCDYELGDWRHSVLLDGKDPQSIMDIETITRNTEYIVGNGVSLQHDRIVGTLLVFPPTLAVQQIYFDAYFASGDRPNGASTVLLSLDTRPAGRHVRHLTMKHLAHHSKNFASVGSTLLSDEDTALLAFQALDKYFKFWAMFSDESQ